MKFCSSSDICPAVPVLEGYKGKIQESHLPFLSLFLIQKKLEILLYRKKSPPTIGCSRDGRFRSGLPGVCSMLKTRVNGTVSPEMDAGLRRGIAAAVVLLIVCVLAVGVVSAADMVTVYDYTQLSNNISNAQGDRTIIVANNISITSQLTIDSGKNITLTTDEADHTLSRNSGGYLFTVNSSGSLTIKGSGSFNLTLDGMKQSPSDSLVLVNGGSFTLADGGILTNNTASSISGYGTYCGGVYVGYGTFTMTGGEISCNTGNLGGGVYVNSGTFTMSGGTISENTASSYGGGVSVMSSSSTFEMSGDAVISCNTAEYGGGVFVVSSGEFTMLGGTISCNKASGTGGGVYVYNYGTFTMSGGSISCNTGDVGGGVYVNSGTFTMSGGSISENTASNNGGGVYVNGGTFELSGSGSTDSVYLTSGKSITVTDALTGTGAQVRGIKLQSPTDDTTVVTGTPLQEDDLSRFELDPSVKGFELKYQNSNIVLKLLPDCMVTFDAQGGSPEPADVTVPYGGMVTEPVAPTMIGYIFTGWYTEEACQNQWDFTTSVTQDMTLYAGWKKDEPGPGPDPTPVPPSGGSSGDGNMENAFRVLFNDGATTLTVQTDLSYGDKLTKPEDPVKDGYTFAGWYKDEACTQGWDFETGIPGDMTLYAKWTTAIEATPTKTATAVTTPQPTAAQTTTATTSIPEATTAAAVSSTLVQTPAPVAGALFGLLAAGVLLRRRQ